MESWLILVVVTAVLFLPLLWRALSRPTTPPVPASVGDAPLREIEIAARRAVDEVLSGEYHTIFKGTGIEFDESRLYQPGDDVRAMDWNVTARTGEAHVKLFREERELSIILLVDLSASGSFGSGERFKVEEAARLAAAIAFSAIRNGDKVGLVAFTDRVERYVPPKKGKKHVLRLIHDILHAEPEGKGTDLAGALRYLDRVAKKRGIVFIISDFVAENFDTPLKRIARRHDVIAVRVTDPVESAPPAAGLIALEDAETGEKGVVDLSDAATRKGIASAAALRDVGLQKMFAAAGVDQVVVTADGDPVASLSRFFKTRERRRRFG